MSKIWKQKHELFYHTNRETIKEHISLPIGIYKLDVDEFNELVLVYQSEQDAVKFLKENRLKSDLQNVREAIREFLNTNSLAWTNCLDDEED